MEQTAAVDPSALEDPENWHGGFYELGIELGDRDDERLVLALDGVWTTEHIEGPWAERSTATDKVAVRSWLRGLTGGHLHGRTTLPDGTRIVCGTWVMREDDGPDWVSFYIPMGALARAHPRVGGYPFAPDGTITMEWRRPIDSWLHAVGRRVYSAAPFRSGTIGFEAAADFSIRDAAELPEPRHVAYLIPAESGLDYYPADSDG